MKEREENIMETSKETQSIQIGSFVKIACNTDLDKKEVSEKAKEKTFVVIQNNKDGTYIVAKEEYKFKVNSFDIKVIREED